MTHYGDDKDRHRSIARIVLQELLDLLHCDNIDILVGLKTADLQRCSPTVMSQANLGNPVIGLACHNGLTSRVTGRMMIKGALGTRFGITPSPYAGINCKDRLPRFQGVFGKQRFNGLAVDLPFCQGIVDAAPASLKTGGQAQMCWGENRACHKQRIGEVKECIATPREELIHVLTKAR